MGKNPYKKNVVASGIHHTRNEFPLIQLKPTLATENVEST